MSLYVGERRYWCLIILLVGLLVIYFSPNMAYKVYLHHSKSLPFLSENFVGREIEKEELMKQLDFYNHSTRIINIYGPPGFGKSTLAIHIGHAAVSKGVEVHYVNMAEFPDKGVKQVLAEKILKKKEHNNFEHLLQWLKSYRYWYYQILLIFDNCDGILHNHGDEFQDAITGLVESSLHVRVLLTSREVAAFPEYAEWCKLDAISFAAAHELLDRRVPKSIGLDPSHKDEIAQLTGNVPLALQIVSSLLRLPNSPSPSEVVQELDKDPIPFLSPTDFPASKQILISIDLSVRHLSIELLIASWNLAIFPGSFDEEAAKAVLDRSVLQVYNSTVRQVLNSLLRQSLLEVNERTLRYQYHRLIREFFLYHIQRYGFGPLLHNSVTAYNVHFAFKLIDAFSQFKYDHQKSLSILYSEQHNFRLLLDFLRTSQSLTEDLVVSIIAVSGAIDVGLLRLHFTPADWCEPIRNALLHLDILAVSFNSNWYHHTMAGLSRESFFNYYVVLIQQLAKCEEINHGIEGAVKVFNDRRYAIESSNQHIRSEDYIKYYEELGNYYSLLGYQNHVVECHRKIIYQANVHLATCMPNQCSNYLIGLTYYKMKAHEKAIGFLEKAVDENLNALKLSRTLVTLFICYASVHSDSKYSALIKLLELHDDIMNLPNNELYHNNDVTQLIITIFRRYGYDQEAETLEERLLEVVLEIRAQPQQGAVSMDRAYRFAQYLFDSGSYHRVVDVGTYILESLDLENPDDVHLKLKVELLNGKAKFHDGNYSEGMEDIELVLLKILNYPESDYVEEEMTSCWYLIPRVKYINTCYGIVAKMGKFVVGTMYLLLQSPFEHHSDEQSGFSFSKDEVPPVTLLSDQGVGKHTILSSSREIAIRGAGSLITTIPFRNMEKVLIILFKTLQANVFVQDHLYLLTSTFAMFTDSVLSRTLYSLIQIPMICFLVNVSCVWIKLWIFYGICVFVRHPLQCSIGFMFVVLALCFEGPGQLRFYIRILRDPRSQASKINV